MAGRKKKSIDPNQPELSFPTEHKKPNIQIGGNIGPHEKYFRHHANGDILLDESFDLTDSWWGLWFAGFPAQPVIVGRSSPMLAFFDSIMEIADSPIWVLLEGPSGTGKELATRAIASVWGGPFQIVNCNFPDGGVSFEDTMFGREEKVLMGAGKMNGRFQLANGGILCLDNVDCLLLYQQSKLLRVSQRPPQIVYKVGSSKGDKVNVRIISTTNQNLPLLVKQRKFREDLYYRIKILQIKLPPLCARKKDIPLLATYLVFKYRSIYGRHITVISCKTLNKLCTYNWPGNVRELENEIMVALAKGKGPIMQPDEFNLTGISYSGYQTFSDQTNNSNSDNRCNNRTMKKRIEEFRAILEQNPGLNTEQLAQIVGCHHRTIERYLDELQDLVISQKNPSDRRHVGYYLNDEQYRTN